MGLFKKVHERTEAKMEEERQKAYAKAIGQGATEAEANAAGERAAVRRRRVRRSLLS
ncbi:hypothetical protein [Streptomyces sp. CA-111067]|uniref:hypothetical protein n=1 Tax=Streptomyces sp. CA-111067 TaxID=3240046 RepID=UPI003D99B6AC